MFRKIVSNLAFSPALVGQLGFYAKRSHDDIFPLKTISFENHDFPCPNNVDACLINSYTH